MEIKHWIIEGCDRLGKDTLINNLIKKFGYQMVIHYSKPIDCEIYTGDKTSRLKEYQSDSFYNGFILLVDFTEVPIIFNRFHLGECVYSPRYRNYSGDYVFELENVFGIESSEHIKLVLLKTSDWSFIDDDGENHDFTQRFAEQDDFEVAFKKSKIKNKVIIDVSNGSGRKTPEEVLMEAIGG